MSTMALIQTRSLYLIAVAAALSNVWPAVTRFELISRTFEVNDDLPISGNATWTLFHAAADPQHSHASPRNESYPFAFAACVIAKDDNLLLPEWIAYHYTVMPLRTLILAVDPLSVTSPMPIIERFRKDLPDLNIDVWTGNAYFEDGRWSKEKFDGFDPYNHSGYHGHMMHRQRQNSFYTKCLRHLRRQNTRQQQQHSWVLLIDTDEYFTYNAILPEEQEVGNVSYSSLRQTLPARIGAPNETIAHWIANDKPFQDRHNTSVCMTYPRLFFSAHEEATPPRQAASVPNDMRLSTKFLHTLRYRSHWNHTKHAHGKSIVHVGNYNGKRKVGNPHNPLGHRCTKASSTNSPFRVHHYSGSLEAWLSSFRRNKAGWEHKNNFTVEGQDNSLSKWFMHFVDMVGEEAARRLVVETQEEAMNESYRNKHRVEVLKESIPFSFEYDRPGGRVKSL